jgi:ribosome-associated heat shock protein Hsp15
MGRGTARDEAPERLRLDKWIWFARFQRARERCAELVRSGYVRINGRRETAPGAFVKVGDVLTIALPGHTEVVRITALGTERGEAGSEERLFLRLEDQNKKTIAL